MAADINYQKCVMDEEHRTDFYTAVLLVLTQEEWAVEIAVLEALSETRSAMNVGVMESVVCFMCMT